MLRASLLRLADDEHLLLLTMHHIASDGWSLRVLWRELELLYDVFRRGADRTCRNWPCSTPIMLCGSGPNCRASDSNNCCSTGASNYRA